jgi:hypothetical protein
MVRPSKSPLECQVARVRRRLFAQTFLISLVWCGSAVLVLAAAWFVLQPHVVPSLQIGPRLAVAGGFLAAGAGSALAWAFRRVHSPTTAGLLLDERFGLQERATTALTLPAEAQLTPAAQALLADVNQRVDQLHISSRFPIWPSWKAALVPAGALGLALLAFFYPTSSGAKSLLGKNNPASAQDSAKPPAHLEEVKQSFAKLKARPREEPADKPLADELKRFEAEENRIAARPHDTQEELRERIKEMNTLQEPMANREKELVEKIQARQQQLQQLNRQAKEEKEQEGPAKDLQKDLAQNKLDQARQEAQQLAKKLEDPKQGLSKHEPRAPTARTASPAAAGSRSSRRGPARPG